MEGFPAVGHGLGLMWEGPWLMPNVEREIEPGMYLAVEILLGHPSLGGAMFEHNGLVTADSSRVARIGVAILSQTATPVRQGSVSAATYQVDSLSTYTTLRNNPRW